MVFDIKTVDFAIISLLGEAPCCDEFSLYYELKFALNGRIVPLVIITNQYKHKKKCNSKHSNTKITSKNNEKWSRFHYQINLMMTIKMYPAVNRN